MKSKLFLVDARVYKTVTSKLTALSYFSSPAICGRGVKSNRSLI